MSWRLEFRPEVDDDVSAAACWYESRQSGLGSEFVEEIILVWEILAEQPLIGFRRHARRDIRWRYPERFPYRVIYSIDETQNSVLVIAVLHGARHDSQWQRRL